MGLDLVLGDFNLGWVGNGPVNGQDEQRSQQTEKKDAPKRRQLGKRKQQQVAAPGEEIIKFLRHLRDIAQSAQFIGQFFLVVAVLDFFVFLVDQIFDQFIQGRIAVKGYNFSGFLTGFLAQFDFA
jgi:hypothetical protein